MNNYKLLFYDFEVFAKLWMVVIIDYDTKEKTIIINDKDKLKNFYTLHKNDIWIGYNSRNYDQFILKGILLGKDPYKINNKIINENKKGYSILKSANSIKFNNFDIATGFHSLKQLEGFMGSMIKESSVPFDLQRELTDDEIKETIKYCTHDVEETINVFEYRKEEFDSQLSLIDAFNLDMSMFNKTKAQLSAHVIGAVKQHSIDDEFNITFPDTLRLNKYKYVLDWYKNPKNRTYGTKQHKKELITNIAGVPHVFAWGGLHAAKKNYVEEGIILCCDVASLYPSIMINYGFLSRNVLEPKKYKEVKETRLKLKKAKNPMQKPYKIVLNATYGASKDRHNPLYDPLMANNVCVTGQLLLLDLIEKIEPYMELIQTNTDGIYMLVKDMNTVEKIEQIAYEWENRVHLTLEWDIYSKIYQRDVNNYIIIAEDGHYKSKGCVKKQSEIDYDLPIITKAMIDYCVNGTSVEDTINNCNNLIEFQKIVKITSLYKYAMYGDEKLPEKVLRVFASTKEDAKGVYKVKGENKIEKLANTPEKCFLDNDNVTNKKVPDYLDRQYYIDLAKDRLADFLSSDNVKKKISTESKVTNIVNKRYESFYDVLVDVKENTNIGFTNLAKYIQIDIFKQYGKVKKLLNFIEYFKVLYKKKKPKKLTLSKYIIDENIFKILEHDSEYNEEKEIYNNLEFEQALKDIWSYLPNDDINIINKLEQQFEMYNDVNVIDENIDANNLFVLAVNQTKNPSIIAYCINNGMTQFIKINKELFKILEIRVGDVIKANNFKQKYCIKVIGKDSKGINILGEDKNKIEWWLTEYEIIYRNYKKDNTLIIDSELENK